MWEVTLPTRPHNIVSWPPAKACLSTSALRGHAQPIAHLVVRQLVPGLFAVREDLPQHDSQAPDVTFCGELPVHDALWRHPTNGQHCVATDLLEKGGEQEGVSHLITKSPPSAGKVQDRNGKGDTLSLSFICIY